MCQWMAGSTHACGHERTQAIVSRCTMATENQDNCPKPEPLQHNSKCTNCDDANASERSFVASVESWCDGLDDTSLAKRFDVEGPKQPSSPTQAVILESTSLMPSRRRSSTAMENVQRRSDRSAQGSVDSD